MYYKPQDDLFSWFCFFIEGFHKHKKKKQNTIQWIKWDWAKKAQQSDCNVQLIKVAY